MGLDNIFGQLGHGDLEARITPTLINSFQQGEVITQVSCGFKHTIAKNSNGKVYTWGWGERGQLGHGNDLNIPFPKRLTFPKPHVTCINVQAGYRASFCIMEGRKIFWWGSNGQIHKQMVPLEYTNETNDEIYYKKNDFRPFKINTTWSRTISVTYITVADCRRLMPKMKHSGVEI